MILLLTLDAGGVAGGRHWMVYDCLRVRLAIYLYMMMMMMMIMMMVVVVAVVMVR